MTLRLGALEDALIEAGASPAAAARAAEEAAAHARPRRFFSSDPSFWGLYVAIVAAVVSFVMLAVVLATLR